MNTIYNTCHTRHYYICSHRETVRVGDMHFSAMCEQRIAKAKIETSSWDTYQDLNLRNDNEI